MAENQGSLERVEVEDMQLRFPPNIRCFVYDSVVACADRAHTTYTISPETEAPMRELFALMNK